MLSWVLTFHSSFPFLSWVLQNRRDTRVRGTNVVCRLGPGALGMRRWRDIRRESLEAVESTGGSETLNLWWIYRYVMDGRSWMERWM